MGESNGIDRNNPVNSLFKDFECLKSIDHFMSNCPEPNHITELLHTVEKNCPVMLDNSTFGILLKSLFRFSFSYLGTTDHLPSDYYKKNQVYLEAQLLLATNEREGYNDEVTKAHINCRVIVRDNDDIKSDSYKNTNDYNKLIKYHDNYGIALYSIDEALGISLSKRYGLRSADMGFWFDNCALVFPRNIVRNEENRDKRIFYLYGYSNVIDSSDYSNCKKYANDVISIIKKQTPLGSISI
jgi:hypothetical protein